MVQIVGFMEATLYTTSMVQKYVVHHGAQVELLEWSLSKRLFTVYALQLNSQCFSRYIVLQLQVRRLNLKLNYPELLYIAESSHITP